MEGTVQVVEHTLRGLWKERLAEFRVCGLSLLYGLLSLLMIFVNKLILKAGSVDNVIGPDALLIIQCIISAFAAFLGSYIFNYSLAISLADFGVCFTVNLAFVGAMLANSYTLRYLSIHMVTLLKCCSVVVTAIGDRFVFHQVVKPLTWISLGLIVVGSSFGLLTDLEFSLFGYFWMFLSIVFSACYVLLSKMLVSHRNVPFFTAVFWNNFTGTFILFVYCVSTSLYKHEDVWKTMFGVFSGTHESMFLSTWFVVGSGILGLILNISTFSLLGETSATSYVVVGAGKKILQAVFSYMFFSVKANVTNVLSVMIGLSGSTLYAFVKWNERNSVHRLDNSKDDSVELLDEPSKLDHAIDSEEESVLIDKPKFETNEEEDTEKIDL